MAIRIGTAPVSWGIMEVEAWARQKSYGEVLDEMVAAGYEGTELGPWGFLPSEPRALQEELSRRGLTLISAFVPMALASPECHQEGLRAAAATAELLAQCGARVIVLADAMYDRRMQVAGSVDPKRDGLSDGQWRQAAEVLMRAARAAGDLGLRAAFHHHAGTYVETPAEVDRLLAETDPALLGLCLDTGHLYYGGGDPVDAVRKHGPRIWHFHLKDIRQDVLDEVRRERIGFLEAVRRGVFCELGAGAVDLPGTVARLSEAGYDGWAVFEQDVDPSRPDARPAESAARSREYLRSKLGL